MSAAPPFLRDFSAPAGRAVELSPLVRRVLAPNAGPMTFTGTCSYVVGRGEVAVIDPGPADPAHVAALLAATAGERVAAILVTHTHADHSGAARLLREKTGAPLLGCAPHRPTGAARADAVHDLAYAPDGALLDGESFERETFSLTAIATPGHTANHLAFALAQEKALFSGDHVMGWSTSVVIPPDGSMDAYMASLDRLRGRDDVVYWPGHGGPVAEPQRRLRALRHHRRQRELAILSRLEKGAARVDEIVAAVYPGLDAPLLRAAGLSTLAHLEELAGRGVVRVEGAPYDADARFSLA
ncbi:MBL fold metallo-hydrolase [Methylocella sp.]|uniref:MBL fold metallo-hydrolase n=1 Tax=Methylocella sp. TaxID=1978226 RepID=UPI0037834DD9